MALSFAESGAKNIAEPSCRAVRKIRVFLLLENRLLREMLARAIRRCRDLDVAGADVPARVTPESIIENGCDILLWDFTDPNWLCFSAEQRRRSETTIQVVAIGMEAEGELLLRCVRSGVAGYLLKDASVAEVLAAVRSAFCGEAICPPRMCSVLFRAVSEAGPGHRARTAQDTGLTLRQERVMKLAAHGLTNKEIANELCLSELTVKNHMSRIMKQLKATNRSEAAAVLRASGYELT